MHTKRTMTTRRGSALLLVIGLLTIIAMLGSTFLLISRLDRKQAVAVAARSQADPLAQGIFSQVKMKLLEDLYIGTNGPYDGSSDVTAYIDYPFDHGTTSNDTWLSMGENSSIQKTSLLGGEDKGNADTDGDGTDDADWRTTGVYNDLGREYQAAVRIVDLSGKLNVNIASHPTASVAKPTYSAPVLIDLMNYLPSGSYTGTDQLNQARRGGNVASNDLDDLNNDLALRVLSPENNFTPFAIGDELFLRWLKSDAVTETGQLFDATDQSGSALGASYRRHLTTFNTTRNVLRAPITSLKTRMPLRTNAYSAAFTETAPDDLTNATHRTELISLLVSAGIDTANAASLVANLWAYSDGQNPASAYEVTDTNGNRYYGLVPQPVLTEVYWKEKYDVGTDADGNPAPPTVSLGVYAVEIYNPDGVDLTNYKLETPGGTDIELSSAGTAQYVAVVYWNGTEDTSFFTTETGAFVINTGTGGLDFNSGSTVKLVRKLGSGIVVDEISTSIPLRTTANTSQDQVEEDGKGRDNSAANKRYLVAAEASMASPTIGAGNALSTAAAIQGKNGENLWYGYDIAKPGGDLILPGNNTLVSLGEITRLMLTCHSKDSLNTWTPVTTALYNDFSNCPASAAFYDVTTQDFDSTVSGASRGRANFFSPVRASSPYLPISIGEVFAELASIVPVDLTREHSDTTASRVYGRLNINTATADALKQLPWPDTVNGTTINIDTLVDEYIIPYRDKTSGITATGQDFTARRGTVGFKTPGEIDIPLGFYADDNLKDSGKTLEQSLEESAEFLDHRAALYQAVANCVSVNSDTFAVYISIRLPKVDSPSVDTDYFRWNYVGVIDRSNCRADGDEPAALLFSPVK